jgi:hypothetical protein
VIALRLAKEGFWGGDPEKVLRARADHVVEAVQYLTFLGDYERAYVDMNRPNE